MSRSPNALVRGERGFSATKFWFSLFAGFACIKFVVAGVTIGSFSFGHFDASGAAALLGVFGGVYGARRYTEANRTAAPAHHSEAGER